MNRAAKVGSQFMNRVFNVICLGLALWSMAPVVYADAQLPIEADNTQVGFDCSWGILPVAGRFEAVQGRIVFAAQSSNPRAVQVTIGSESLTTGHAAIDRQLNGPDFFDSSRYPAIVFESTEVRETDAGRAQASGRLTVKDITRPVTLHVALDPQPPDGLSRLGREAASTARLMIRASARIHRSEFGMAGFNPLISDECTIQIRVALPAWRLNQ
jgi:polyisoprenoid-binding protein YceI